MDSATIETLYKKFAEAIPGEKQILTSKQVPGMPSHGFYEQTDEGWDWTCFPQPRLQITALDIKSLIGIGRKNTDEDRGDIYCTDDSIFLSFEVTEVQDEGATFNLHYTRQFELLQQWDKSGSGVALTQPELVFILRTTLYGCYNSHPTLLGITRKIDTRKVQEATGVVERSKASISKSLMAEVSGMDALPEIVTFEIPVHQERAFRVNVRVAFEFDPQLEKFRLVVLPGELTKALIDTRQNIATEIADVQKELGTSFPVFYGTP